MVHRRGGRSNKSGTQSDSGGVGLVDEKELELSDFSVTDTEDEDLFTTHVEHDKNYMSNWWGKFVGDGYRAEGGSDGGSEYADSEELLSLYGSDDETTSQRRTRYHEFNEKHDMRIPIVLEKGLLFADTYGMMCLTNLTSNSNTMTRRRLLVEDTCICVCQEGINIDQDIQT
jgi:hypothetical protein